MLDSDAQTTEAGLRRERDDALLRAESAEAFLDEARARIEQLEQELADKPAAPKPPQTGAELKRRMMDDQWSQDQMRRMVSPPKFDDMPDFYKLDPRHMIPTGPKVRSPRPERYKDWTVDVRAEQDHTIMKMRVRVSARRAGDPAEDACHVVFTLDVTSPGRIGKELSYGCRAAAAQLHKELGIRDEADFAQYLEAQTILAIVMQLK